MRFVYFTHSLMSCWNHGNAHFLRGMLRELLVRGHAVRSFEPCDAWSRSNLLRDHGTRALEAFHSSYPDLAPNAHFHQPDIDAMLDGADVVLVHEWNDPALIGAIGSRRREGGRFVLLFHDTHHRAVSHPEALRSLDLSGYDGVLAFGAVLADIYRRMGWGPRAFIWHEAADTRLFCPPVYATNRDGIVWVGNWGDNERSEELQSYLLAPAAELDLNLDVYGVRYPPEAIDAVARFGASYRGWLANSSVPDVFAHHMMTVHVPRRFYVQQLPGIPTIRMFEALACGIPLICSAWSDSESLFTPWRDYLPASSPAEMLQHMRTLKLDADMRRELAEHGLATISQRHTCGQRVDELLAIVKSIQTEPQAAAA